MHKRFLPARRRFLQGMTALFGATLAWPFRRAFGETSAAAPGSGAHLVVMTVIDKDHTWTARAQVGDDPTVAAKYVRFTDAQGKRHRGLDAWFYADCVEAGATSLANAYDYINVRSVTVTYDGKSVPVPRSSKKDGTYDFWRGCRCPAIRYGKQVGWSADKIDWSLLPTYAKGRQAPWDDSKMDFSFNGLGEATTPAMGDGGSRPDIGYMSAWNLAFITNPSAETWAVVRRADDHDGGWGMVFTSDPDTGGIVTSKKYPDTTIAPQAQVHDWVNNALVPYAGSYDGDTLIVGKAGPLSWQTTLSPYVPSDDHLTSYALLSAMVTGTAHDRDHVSFWSAFPMLVNGLQNNAKYGCACGIQRRFAWCLRNLFMATYVSSDTAYFAADMAHNLQLAMARATNPVGAYDTSHAYPRKAIKDGGQVGLAPWMQYYLMTVLDPVARKQPKWMPFARFLAKFAANWMAHPYTACAGIYSFVVMRTAANGVTQTQLDDFPLQVQESLVANGCTAAQAKAIVNARAAKEVYDALVVTGPGGRTVLGKPWPGKFANGESDFVGYVGDPMAYGAMAMAAFACAYNTGAPGTEGVPAYLKNIPTKPDFSHNFIFNIVPRSA